MSNAEQPKTSLYHLVEVFLISLLVGAAMTAVLLMLDASPRALLATALGAPGVYFLGQRYRRLRARRQVSARQLAR